MRTHETLFQEALERIEGREFAVVIESVLDDESASVELHVRVLDKDVPVTIVTLKGSVTNPLDLFGVILLAAGAYGWCVGMNFLGSTGKIVLQAYEASRAKQPELPAPERCKDILSRVKERGTEFRGEAVKILTGCFSRIIT